MKKIFLLIGMVAFSIAMNAQQIIWDTIISFGAQKDIPAKIIGNDVDVFYIIGYTGNSGNSTTDAFLLDVDITTPGSFSFVDSIYHTPGHFEKIYDAYNNYGMGNIEIVGSDSVPSEERSSLDLIYDGVTGFSPPQVFDLALSQTDEFICAGSSGSQAKDYGVNVFGYGINGGYYNETNFIDGGTPLLIPKSSNRYYFSTGDDSYSMMAYAVGFNDSSGTKDPLVLSNQYGSITTKTTHMAGNQVLYSFSSPQNGIAEFGAGYSDNFGTKDAFLIAFDSDPYSLDTLWTRTYHNPLADEVVYATLLKDTILYLFGNQTIGSETDIFVKEININTGNLFYEYTLGTPGLRDSVVSVTQNDGCTFLLLTAEGNHAHVYKLPVWNFSVSATDISCYGNVDGAINAVPAIPSGFVINYYDATYSQVLPSNLPEGTYIVEMVDTPYFNCMVTNTVTIHQPDSLYFAGINYTPTCYADSNGVVDIAISGGTPGFSYNWTGPSGYTNNTEDISGLFPGTYSLTVTDTMGCQQTTIVDIGEAPEIIIGIDSIKNVLCNGDANGGIFVTVLGGIPGYTYSWSDISGYTSNYEDIWNIYAGDYFLTVTDTMGCQKADTITINEPLPLMVSDSIYPVSCQGLFDGAINLNVSGGTSPYLFNWTGPNSFSAITDSIFGLEVGIYNYTVTDTNGCTQNGGQTLTAPPPATITGVLSIPSYGPVDVGDALIYLYKDTSFSGSAYQIAAYDSTVVMFNGDFNFNSLFNADYYLMAKVISPESIYDNVVTTYYDTVVNWFNAVPVTLQCGDNDTIQMQMIKLPPLTGTGSISGYIYMNGSKAMGEPVPGAEVFAEQEPDEHPIANSTTDTAGFYHIGGLPLGSKSLFKLTVDIPGLPLMSTYTGIGLDATNDSLLNMNFVVDTTSGGGIYVDTTSGMSIHNITFLNYLSIYPNPFSKNLNVEFSTDNKADVNMEIIDISGRVVYRKDFRSIVGKNQVEINTQTNISGSGTFFLKIASGNNVLIKKIIKR